jgi:hypothetical protein
VKAKIGLLLVLAVGCFGIAAVIRLRQRSEFRDKMRPLVEEDLSDYAQESSSFGGLTASAGVSRREKRIAQIKLFDAGHYRDARDVIVRLMEAENQFIAVNEEMHEISVRTPLDLNVAQLGMTRIDLAGRISGTSECAAMKDELKHIDDLVSDMRLAFTLPGTAERVRKEAVSAWNAAYGWIRWLGLDIDPHNPFGSLETFIERHNHTADLEEAERNRSFIVGVISSRCKGAR